MVYLFLEIIISVLISSIPILIQIKSKKKNKEKIILSIIASLILLIGCLIRIIGIEKYPIGLNQDEASIGYEAYSLLKYGIDRNGQTLPVHFIAWGSGQNSLYGYLIIPIVLIFKNTVFSIRFSMSLIGCLTLLVAFLIFDKEYPGKKRNIMIFIFSIIPWHILKSRWGLESNLFPDLIFFSLALIYFGIKTEKKHYFILSSVVLGISTYSYGTSYLFVPIFILLTYGYLYLTKKISLKNTILYLLITTIISIPMILFTIINYFDLNTIKILNITIPKLDYNRFTEMTSIKGNFIINCFNNIKNTIKIIINQNDNLILNCYSKYGILYKYSLPFIILGIYESIKNKKNILLKLNNILFISSICICLFTIPNINRINVLWISIIIYLCSGILCIYSLNKKVGIIIVLVYLISFTSFSYNYFNNYQKEIGNRTFYGLEDSIIFANKREYNNLYITETVNQPYIFYLYFSKINPNYYIKNRYIPIKKTMFQRVERIDNVYFMIPQEINKGNIYIIPNNQLNRLYLSDFKIKTFKNYSVVY